MHNKLIYSCLQNEKLVSFVKKQYITSYKRYFIGHEDDVEDMIEKAFHVLISSQKKGSKKDDLSRAVYDISKNIFQIKNDSFWFNKLHYAYKTLIRPKKDFESISSHIKGKTIHDFGCDGGFFSLELLRNHYGVVMSDVIDHRISEVAHLPFYLMKKPNDVGFVDKSISTIVVKTVLHHIDKKYIVNVLKKLRMSQSRLIIEEDTYGFSDSIQYMSDSLLSQKAFKVFASFSKEEQYLYCVLTDYFSNAVIYGRPDITFPFKFKTIDEWKELFKAAGFTLNKCIINGFNDWKLTQNCQVWFVLD